MSRKSIGKYLSICRRAHAKLLDKELKNYEISHAQLSLLMALYNREGIYQQELCRLFNLNKAAVARELSDLEDKNFITKKRDHDDRRRFLIYLTEKAQEQKQNIIAILDKIEHQMRLGLSENEVDEFIRIIRKICTNLNVTLKERK